MASLRTASIVLGVSVAGVVAMACANERASASAESANEVNAAASDLVISQIYVTGGTKDGFKNDYVELFNRGTADVSLDGTSIQVAGKGAFAAAASVDLPATTLAAGQHYLVKLAGGTAGQELSGADHTADLELDAATGKIALVRSGAKLANCGTNDAPCDPAARLDLVGYGDTTQGEGNPVESLTEQTAALRRANGCTDSGNNSADFEVAEPSPRTLSSAATPCPRAGDAGATGDAGDAGADGSDAAVSSDAAARDSGDAAAPPKKPESTKPAPPKTEAKEGTNEEPEAAVSSEPVAAKKPAGAAPASSESTCAMASGPVGSSKIPGILGFGLAISALVRRRRPAR